MFNIAARLSGGFAKVYTPSITSPTANQTIASVTPTLTVSAFSKYGNINHASTDWQVAEVSDFSTIRWQSLNDSSNKTSITTTSIGGGNRYVRVRFKTNTGLYSDWSTPVFFTSPAATPAVSFTTNIATTVNTTAGNSGSFTVAATDTANTGGGTVSYQWYLSTNGGSSYSPISGETTSTLGRYSTFYYSDNTHKIKCRATVTNAAGTSFTDSNVCTLNVGRNYDCNGSTVTGSVTISGEGLKPSGESSDEEWGSWSPGYGDICEINGSTSTFSAGGRCDIGCRIGGVYQGYQLQLELRIERSNGTRLHWGDQTRSSSSCGRSSNFQINANGGGWTPETDGTPTFRLLVIASGTNCLNGAGEAIFAESDTATLNYSYKRRRYFYETRP